MRRSYKKPSRFDPKKLGQVAFTLFLVFVAYKILTPPSQELARIDSPDGSKTARLQRFYYLDGQPSYKVHYREKGKHLWVNLLHLPAHTNAPPDSPVAIEWNEDSKDLYLLIDGISVWHYNFGK